MYLLATSILKDLSASVCDVCSLQRPGKSLNIFYFLFSSLSLFFLVFQTEVVSRTTTNTQVMRHSESLHFKLLTYGYVNSGQRQKSRLFILNAALLIFMK